MKPSSFVALIGSLAINGFNTFHQPAVAEQSPLFGHIAEALSLTNASNSETNSLVIARVGEKYGYKDASDKLVIPARFDNCYDFFDGLALD
jgi:WG containing repeat